MQNIEEQPVGWVSLCCQWVEETDKFVSKHTLWSSRLSYSKFWDVYSSSILDLGSNCDLSVFAASKSARWNMEIPFHVCQEQLLEISSFRQLGGNNITSLESVRIPSSLTTLSLEKNKIEELHPKVFSHLPHLHIL